MTAWRQLSLRAHAALDRLAWGLGDLKRALMERGGWPATSCTAIALDGGRWSVTGTRARRLKGDRRASALLVPEPECLWGNVQLPDMPRRSLPNGVEETLWRVSPLPPDQIVAAWQAEPLAQGGWSVQWGMCRRNTLVEHLGRQGLSETAQVYLMRNGAVFPVRGDAWRKQDRRQGLMDCAGVVVLLILLAALALPALMPLVLKRQAVVRAVSHVSALEPQAAPLRQKMDELRRQALLAEELRKNISADVPLASVIDALSGAIPADTWLDRIEVNGSEIRITGLTANATELTSSIARAPGLVDVRSTGANVRDGTLNKERFTFEMRWRGEGVKP